MLLHGAQPQETVSIPGGQRGTRVTLRHMARLARGGRTDPAVRDLSRQLTMHLADHAYHDEARELFYFVRDHIRYLQDPNGVEQVSSPDATLQHQAGDCDDKATLLAAMLESIGHPARFVAVGFAQRGTFDHVFVETKIGRKWVAADATVQEDFGWSPLIESRALAYMQEYV